MGGANVVVTAPYTEFYLHVTGWNSTPANQTPTCEAGTGSSTITSIYNNGGGTGNSNMHTGIWRIKTTIGNTLKVYSTGNGIDGYAQIYAVKIG